MRCTYKAAACIFIIMSVSSICAMRRNVYQLNKQLRNISEFHMTIDLPPTKHIQVNYTITFFTNVHPWLPITGLGPRYHGDVPERNAHCFKESFIKNVGTHGNFYIVLNQVRRRRWCTNINDTYVCSRMEKYYTIIPSNWELLVAFECGEKKVMNVNLNLTFISDISFSCEELRYPHCGNEYGYNQTMLPNIVGEMQQSNVEKVRKIIFDIILLHQAKMKGILSYQHIFKVLCLAGFPKCWNGVPYPPCRKMCLEATAAYADILKEMKAPISCSLLPPTFDQDICFYEPVTCAEPESPKHGSVVCNGYHPFNTSQYSCKDGYQLQGDGIRYCSYSGKWNGSIPVCTPYKGIDKSTLWAVIAVLLTVLVLSLLVTGVLCLWKLVQRQISLNRYNQEEEEITPCI